MTESRTQTIAKHIFAQIAPRFEEDRDYRETFLTCPIDGVTTYVINPDMSEGQWYVAINNYPNDLEHLNGLPSIDAAKAQVALLIASKIVAAEAVIAVAEAEGLIPA